MAGLPANDSLTETPMPMMKGVFARCTCLGLLFRLVDMPNRDCAVCGRPRRQSPNRYPAFTLTVRAAALSGKIWRTLGEDLEFEAQGRYPIERSRPSGSRSEMPRIDICHSIPTGCSTCASASVPLLTACLVALCTQYTDDPAHCLMG